MLFRRRVLLMAVCNECLIVVHNHLIRFNVSRILVVFVARMIIQMFLVNVNPIHADRSPMYVQTDISILISKTNL